MGQHLNCSERMCTECVLSCHHQIIQQRESGLEEQPIKLVKNCVTEKIFCQINSIFRLLQPIAQNYYPDFVCVMWFQCSFQLKKMSTLANVRENFKFQLQGKCQIEGNTRFFRTGGNIEG